MNEMSLIPPPLVTILVPVHNVEKYIYETIVNLLSEKRILLELIVIDDHSTDSSVEIIRQFNDERMRIIKSTGNGVATALNCGLKNALGEVIMRCDADDLYATDRIFNQVNWLSRHSNYGAVCGGFSAIDEAGTFINELTKQYIHSLEITKELRNGQLRTSFCTFAVRTSILRQLGGFRAYFKSSEDIDMQFRLAESCRIWYQQGSNYSWRLHGSSITHTQPNFERNFYEARAREMQLQRGKEGKDDLMKGIFTLPQTVSKKKKIHSSNQHVAELLLGKAWQEYSLGKFGIARQLGLQAIIKNPLNVRLWKSFVVLMLKSYIS